MPDSLKIFLNHLFWALALLGLIDFVVQVCTDGRVRIIRGVLGVLFG